MFRSNLEWILIAGFVLFHFLFLFIATNSIIFLGLSSLFFVFLSVQYMIRSGSAIYYLPFALNAGSAIAIFMKIGDFKGAPVVMIAGMVGYVLIALILTFSALQNKKRFETSTFLPYAITGLVIAQVVLFYFPDLTQYSIYLNYPIFLFSGQILLSRISRGQEPRGFYYALKLVLLSSGISVLDQTISSF